MNKRLIALCLIVAMVACSGAFAVAADAPSGDPIIIGSINGVTQQGDLNSISIVRAMEVAVEEINEAGGIGGRPVKFENYDIAKHDVQMALNGYNYLVDEVGATVIVGTCVSNVGLALMDMAQDKKVPMVGLWIDSTITKDKETGEPVPYMYLAQPTNAAMAYLSADYMTKVLGLEKIALFYDETSAFTVSQVEQFKKYCEENGVAIVAEQTYITDTTDYRTHLTVIRDSGADGVYALGGQTNNSIYLNTLDQLGMVGTVTTMGDVNYAPPFLAALSDPSIVEDMYFPLNVDLEDPRLERLANIYMEKWNDVPEMAQISVKYYLGYDIAQMMFQAIEKVLADGQELTGENVNTAMESVSIEGVSGPLAFTPESHQTGSVDSITMYIYSIHDGGYHMVEPYTYETK